VRTLNERWRPVADWEGAYEVSNFGRVRSVSRWVQAKLGRRLVEGRILKLKRADHYFVAYLCDGDRELSALVHRLVASAFVPGAGQVVRHLDGNGFNNLPSNLAWGSYADNEADKALHGRVPKGLSHPRAVLTAESLAVIRDMHGRGFSQLAIARHTKLNRGVVGTVVRGETYRDV